MALKLKRLPKTTPEGNAEMKWEPDERPSLCFNDDQLPEIKEWKVGSKYKLIVEVEMTSCNIRKQKDVDRTYGDFKVLAVAANPEEK